MKKIAYYFAGPALMMLPMVAGAQPKFDNNNQAGNFLNSILTFVNTTAIPFILGIGFLVFVWGMFQYFIAGGANDDAKAKGKSLMVYATLGFVLVIIFWGVIGLVANTTGLNAGTAPVAPTVTVP